MKTLIFFDINGTLIKRDDRTDIPFSNAVNSLLNTDNAMYGIDTSARSDKDVFIEILSNFKIKFSSLIWHDFLKLYEHELEKFKSSDVWRENVDAVSFVKYLSGKGYTLGLITGELSIGAKYKLSKIGVYDYFLNGGFGEDGLKRFDIADSAYLKIQTMTKKQFSKLFVIGDTVLDIQTARHLNAHSIAITTGSHSKEKLLSQQPDYCIDKFEEIKYLF